jgi:hypothetical protein
MVLAEKLEPVLSPLEGSSISSKPCDSALSMVWRPTMPSDSEFVASDTDVVVTWSKISAIEFYLRDTVFNRGHAGAALGAEPDGVVGPRTPQAPQHDRSRPLR